MKNNTYNIMDKVYEVGNKIKNNAHIYGFAALITVTSCTHSHTFTDYSGNIGKNFIVADRNFVRHKGTTTTSYKVEKVLEDGSRVVYTDGNNDRDLKDKHTDFVRVYTPDDKLTMIPQGAALDSANVDYHNLRDTIDSINKKEKSVMDQKSIDKYFN